LLWHVLSYDENYLKAIELLCRLDRVYCLQKCLSMLTKWIMQQCVLRISISMTYFFPIHYYYCVWHRIEEETMEAIKSHCIRNFLTVQNTTIDWFNWPPKNMCVKNFIIGRHLLQFIITYCLRWMWERYKQKNIYFLCICIMLLSRHRKNNFVGSSSFDGWLKRISDWGTRAGDNNLEIICLLLTANPRI
jgi:hypothetical protein